MNTKFRAWDKKTNKMYPVDSLAWDLSGNLEEVWLVGVEPTDDKESYTNLRTPDEVILEQSTGLFDKNGAEIWTGDIIRDFDDEILIVETTGTAYVSDKTCAEQHWDDWEKNNRYSRLRCLEKLRLDTGYYKAAGTQIEVIGNVHESNMEESCA